VVVPLELLDPHPAAMSAQAAASAPASHRRATLVGFAADLLAR
jgi:hypothetical protein